MYRSAYNSTTGSYQGILTCTYEYDPYGRPLGIYDANGNEISQNATIVSAYNPFRYRGYRYDGDTGLYYLESRYYDPVTGRFINADSYASTGQGLLGYNMFAYCNNNPVIYADNTGNYSDKTHLERGMDGICMGIAAVVVVGSAIVTSKSERSDYHKVYGYAKSLVDSAVKKFEDHQPRVHHIVPIGSFSNRSPEIQEYVQEMQNILIDVGITPFYNPANLVILSHGFHKSLHTDAYITLLHDSLVPATGNREAVLEVLFCFRIVLRISDSHARW